jgi:hypothetical protein
MRFRKALRWLKACVVAGVLVLLFLLLMPLLDTIHEGIADRRPKPLDERRAATIRAVAVALHWYCLDHGSFPQDPRGSEYALYRLGKRFVMNADEFDRHGGYVSPWTYDDDRAVVIHSLYDYLNEPMEFLPHDDEPIIVLAEKLTALPCTIRYVDNTCAVKEVKIPQDWKGESLVGVRESSLRGLPMRTIMRMSVPHGT